MNTVLKKYIEYNKKIIEYSIVTPIYNQENIIIKNIKSFIEYTLGNFELILINDFSSDNTLENILDFFNNYKNTNNNLIKVKIFDNTKYPLFETKCDNIGFKNAEGKYILEIQADMEMIEIGYNLHLTKPFKLLDNVIAVSGRCAHNLFRPGGIGKLGINIEKSIENLNIDKNTFYVYETCNRGPLLIDKHKLNEASYLDEKNYFLDNSDHDLMLRAYLNKKYICGYVPINFKSPLEDGSNRKKKKIINKKDIININILNNLKKIKSNGQFLNNYKKYWKNLEPKTYKI